MKIPLMVHKNNYEKKLHYVLILANELLQFCQRDIKRIKWVCNFYAFLLIRKYVNYIFLKLLNLFLILNDEGN